MDRIKFINEELRSIGENMTSQIETLEKEERAKTPEEKAAWDGYKEKKRAFEAELVDLLEMENEKKTRALEEVKKRNAIIDAKTPEEKSIKVGEERGRSDKAMYEFTEEMLRGVVGNSPEMVYESQKKLIENGHFGIEAQKEVEERDGFSTLKDGKGGVFIPTVITDKIFDMEQEYGVIPKYCENFGISESRKKIPSILSRPSFYAVVEKAAIPGSSLNFGGMMLDPNKWACIVDWTNEVGREAGNKILPILMKKVAEASAYLKDNVVFNATGASIYHTKKGLITKAADTGISYVSKVQAGSGDTTLASIDASDLSNLKFGVTAAARSRGVYVCHPDYEQHLQNLKDGAGTYIWGGPANSDATPTIWRRPLVYSEAFPVADAVNSPVMAYFDPSYLAYGTGTNMSVTKLTEASITDEDGNTVNLATQDSSALRFIESFDFEMSDKTVTTEGVAKGAFSVLYTAAS